MREDSLAHTVVPLCPTTVEPYAAADTSQYTTEQDENEKPNRSGFHHRVCEIPGGLDGWRSLTEALGLGLQEHVLTSPFQ